MQGMTARLTLAALLLGSGPVVAAQAPPTFPSDTHVVVLDVVAKDRKGRLLDDLRPGELQVFEDGRPCEIRSLRLVRAAAPPRRPPSPAERGASPDPAPASPARPSLVVLVFDRLKIEWAPLARKGALDLLSRRFPPDTYFAVFKIGYRLRLLQAFTTDPMRLRAAVLKATGGDRDTRVEAFAPELPPSAEEPADSVRSDERNPRLPDLRQVAESLGDPEVAEDQRIGGLDTLYGLLGVTRALGAVEGRKAIVYFSGAWHLGTALLGPYEDAVSEAYRANVAIHTVDARGLTAEPPFVATLGPLAPQPGGRGGPPRPAAHLNDGADLPTPQSWSSQTMEDRLMGPNTERLADDTGGLAIGGTNDLGEGLSVVAEELGQYYELVYAPANPDLDGRFRHVAVKVSRPGVSLRTRAGYFATPAQSPKLAARELPLMTALGDETPPHDFALRTGVLHFAPAGVERQCVLLAEVPLSEVQVSSDEAGDVYRAHLTFLALVRDAEGRVIARLSHDWPIEGPLLEKEQARERNAIFRRTLPLAPGRYALETAVQDQQSGALSVTRAPFEVPPAGRTLALGSVSLLRRVEASEGTTLGNPLGVGDLLLFPALEPSFVAGSLPELPFFVGVYPAGPGRPVELTVELRRDARVVGRTTTTLPDPDMDGRIPWIGGIPSDGLRPGSYEIVVTVRQGEATAEERTRFEVSAAREPDAGPGPG